MEKQNYQVKMQNTHLIQEITLLKEANKALTCERDALKKKHSSTTANDHTYCPQCGFNGNASFSPSTNPDEPININETMNGFDNGFLTRDAPSGNGSFFGKNFFSYTFACATILSMALLINMNPPGSEGPVP
jgi:hypothetical protein